MQQVALQPVLLLLPAAAVAPRQLRLWTMSLGPWVVAAVVAAPLQQQQVLSPRLVVGAAEGEAARLQQQQVLSQQQLEVEAAVGEAAPLQQQQVSSQQQLEVAAEGEAAPLSGRSCRRVQRLPAVVA